MSNLQQHLLPIKDEVAKEQAFGIGLRLSALAASELAEPAAMQAFKSFLNDHNCYVFTINGFPYGQFHGTRVKEDVYLPDWKDDARLRYTNQLAEIFAEFLPSGLTGSISTVPGAFKARVKDEADIQRMAIQMINHVAFLHQLEERTGAKIILALEPEPCCFLETIDESVAFFKDHLYADYSINHLAEMLNVDSDKAWQLIKDRLTLCFDLCHAAVEFEDAQACIKKLQQAEVTIGKIQISAGLRLTNVDQQTIELLKPFDDNVYLHQVVESHNGQVTRYTDLPEAFAAIENTTSAKAANREWRVHFHVPIFLDNLGEYSSTRFFIEEFMQLNRTASVTDHFEVETYTWNVLPDHCKTDDIDTAIVRELEWAKAQLTNQTTDQAAKVS